MSSINPNNINGQYPVAGQDNDSQGFRDNFTNIINNFTFAYNELNDLQQNAVLKNALSGTALSNDMNYAQLIKPQLLNVVETQNPIVGAVSGSKNISWLDGDFQKFTTGADVVLGITNWPQNGTRAKLRLQITTGANVANITFPTIMSNVGIASIQGFVSGQQIRLDGSGIYQFELSSSDNGGTLHIQDVLRNYNVETSAVSLTITTINASGNVSVGGNVGLFGNTTHGRVGAGSGAFHTFVGNITQTSSGGAVYINTTGNVSGAVVNAGALNSTGLINTTGNVLSASVTTGALINNGNIIIADPIGAGSFGSNLTVKGTINYKTQDQANNFSVATTSKSLTLEPGGDQFLLLNITANCAIGYNATIVRGHQTTVHVKNSAGALAYVIVPNNNTTTGNAFIGLADGQVGQFIFTSYGTDAGNIMVTVTR